MKNQKFVVLFLGFFLLLGVVSCRTIPISELSQDDGISRIRNNFEEKNWTDVISNVDEYKARYPYSKNIPEAELIQANAYYLSGKYPEAIAAYEDFARKNPIDKNVPLAYYRIANSYDLEAPEEIDREQASAKKAISGYQYYVKNYANDVHVTESKERIKILTRRLAENELFIARFYWRKDLYSAALARYLGILKNYSQFNDLKEEAKERSAVCYEELADILEDDPESDKFLEFKGKKPEDLRNKAQEMRSAQ